MPPSSALSSIKITLTLFSPKILVADNPVGPAPITSTSQSTISELPTVTALSSGGSSGNPLQLSILIPSLRGVIHAFAGIPFTITLH